MWRRGKRHDLGARVLGWTAAILGWDFIYYWNHRFMHDVRWLWAHHVVHHSSERYNLSTALRQAVAESLGVYVPYGVLSSVGVRPGLVFQTYLDRNHGSILIIWDRLFGAFQRDEEPVVYGLTRNIKTFDPVTAIGHEFGDVVRDIARSRNWRDRLSFALRGPGWAYARHAGALTPSSS